MNAVHVPVALGAIALLPAIIVLGYFGRIDRRGARLALFVLVALIGNAAICGIFSINDDR
jgi:hypothetical protein